MKVGIITFTVENFGAQLQAYALQHKLSLLGYDAEICDVQIEPASEEIRKRAKNKEWKRSLFSKDFFRTLQRIISKIIIAISKNMAKVSITLNIISTAISYAFNDSFLAL